MASPSATDPELEGSLDKKREDFIGSHDKHGKLLEMLSKVPAKKAHQTSGKEANAPADCPQPEFRQAVPPGLLVRDGSTPLVPPGEFITPKGLAPAVGLAGPNHSMAEKCGMTAVPGSDAYGEADAMSTGVEPGLVTDFGTSDCKELRPQAAEFQMKADAPCFVPGVPMPLVLCCFGPDDELPSETARKPNGKLCKPITEFQMRVAEAKKTLEALDMPVPRNQRRLVHTAEAALLVAKRMSAEAQALVAKRMSTTVAPPSATDPDIPASSKPSVPINHNKIPTSIKETDAQKRSDLSIFFGAFNESAPPNRSEMQQIVEEANDGKTSGPPDPLSPIKSTQQEGDEDVPRIVTVADAEMPQTLEDAIDEKRRRREEGAERRQRGGEKVAQIVQVADAKKTRTAMATLSWTKSKEQSGLLGALNLSMPTKHRKLRQILAKAADCRIKSQTRGKAADAAVVSTLLDPGMPPGLSQPDSITPPEDLAPSAGLAKADAAAMLPLPDLGVTPDRSRPDAITPPEDLAPTAGLAQANAVDLLDPGAPPGLSRPAAGHINGKRQPGKRDLQGVTPPEDCAPPAGLATFDAVALPPPSGLEALPGFRRFTTTEDLSPPPGLAKADAVALPPSPGLEAPPGLSGNVYTAQQLLALKPERSTPPKGLPTTLADADARKACQNFDTAPDAAVPALLSGLEAQKGPKTRKGKKQPKGLAEPAGLAGPSCSKVGDSQNKAVSISEDYIQSDAKVTNDDTGSITGRGSSDCEEAEPEPELEDFQEKADAPCFAALPSETTRTTQKATLQTLLGKRTGLLALICVFFFFFTLLFGFMLPEDVAGKVLPARLVPVLEVLVPVLEVIVPVIVVGSMVWRGVWSGQDQAGECSPKSKCA